MAGVNWVDLIKKAKTAMDTLNQVKGMVNALNDLNFESLAMGLAGDMLSQLPSLAGISPTTLNGLSTVSQLAGMNPAQQSLISNLTGATPDVISSLASGNVPSGMSTDQLNGLVTSMGSLAGMGSMTTFLSDYATSQGATELTPELTQQAVASVNGNVPGMPSPVGTTLEDATALLGTVNTIQQQLGGSLNSIGSSLSSIFPSGDVAVGNISPTLLSSVGIDPSAFSSDVSSLLGGATGAASSLSSAASALGGLGSDQLADLTSSIYNMQNIQARIQRTILFQLNLTSVLSPLGISISF
jgi:hypothetical protein